MNALEHVFLDTVDDCDFLWTIILHIPGMAIIQGIKFHAKTKDKRIHRGFIRNAQIKSTQKPLFEIGKIEVTRN